MIVEIARDVTFACFDENPVRIALAAFDETAVAKGGNSCRGSINSEAAKKTSASLDSLSKCDDKNQLGDCQTHASHVFALGRAFPDAAVPLLDGALAPRIRDAAPASGILLYDMFNKHALKAGVEVFANLALFPESGPPGSDTAGEEAKKEAERKATDVLANVAHHFAQLNGPASTELNVRFDAFDAILNGVLCSQAAVQSRVNVLTNIYEELEGEPTARFLLFEVVDVASQGRLLPAAGSCAASAAAQGDRQLPAAGSAHVVDKVYRSINQDPEQEQEQEQQSVDGKGTTSGQSCCETAPSAASIIPGAAEPGSSSVSGAASDSTEISSSAGSFAAGGVDASGVAGVADSTSSSTANVDTASMGASSVASDTGGASAASTSANAPAETN